MYFWLLVVGLIGIIGSFIVLVIFVSNFVKDKSLFSLTKKEFLQFGISLVLIGIFTVLFLFGMVLYDSNPNLADKDSGYNYIWHVSPKEYFYLIFFGFLLGCFSGLIFVTYYLCTRKLNLSAKNIRYLRALTIILIPLILISFLFSIEGLANNLFYPLVNGINFGGDSFIKLTRVNENISGGLSVKMYGIFIILGFLIAYGVSERYFYKRYKQHGLMDLMLLVVLVFGLLGARLWYCLVLEPGIYLNNPIAILRVWEGGLAIEGGALLGIVFGALYFVLFNKKVNVRNAFDYVVPSILFGQICGRIGNFLNHEVYGAEVARSSINFFPTLVLNQMYVPGKPDMVFVPLFLIEMIVNLCGYFIIRFLIGEGLKKFRSLGDLCFVYISWYGLVRVIMEPLRDQQFGYQASYIASWCMFGGGILLFIALHLYDFLKYGKDDLFIYIISLLSKKPVYLKDRDLGPYKGKDSVFLHNGKKPKEKIS